MPGIVFEEVQARIEEQQDVDKAPVPDTPPTTDDDVERFRSFNRQLTRRRLRLRAD